MAVKALKEKQVKRIILTRPAVEAGENLGFLRRYEEKLDPYMQPLYDALRDMLLMKAGDYILKGIIQIAPCLHARTNSRSRFCNFRRGAKYNTFSNENVPPVWVKVQNLW
jgi:phosphate starvation-inducible PhoH-like protein